MNLRQIICLLTLTLWFTTASAEGEKDGTDIEPAETVLIFEGVVALNAWMAAQEPKIYGGVALLLFPVAGAYAEDEPGYWLGLAAAESLALYNLTLDEDKYSKSEIFRHNMLGWHLMVGVFGLTGWLAQDAKDRTAVTYSLQPAPDGAELRLAFRF